MSSSVFEYLEDPKRTLELVAGRLRSGGHHLEEASRSETVDQIGSISLGRHDLSKKAASGL